MIDWMFAKWRKFARTSGSPRGLMSKQVEVVINQYLSTLSKGWSFEG